MNLGEVIEILEMFPGDKVVKRGFNNPHSYRGFYERLAFEPADFVTINSMLHCCAEAEGRTYSGWKGGEYRMNLKSLVHIAVEGDCDGSDCDSLGITREELLARINEPLTDAEVLANLERKRKEVDEEIEAFKQKQRDRDAQIGTAVRQLDDSLASIQPSLSAPGCWEVARTDGMVFYDEYLHNAIEKAVANL